LFRRLDPPNGKLNKLFVGGGAVEEVEVVVAVGLGDAAVVAGAGFDALDVDSVCLSFKF
jgi:hypothetical protein